MVDPMIEIACRAYCAAAGIDPDKRTVGIGDRMPKGQEYALWEYQIPFVSAAITALQRPMLTIKKNSGDPDVDLDPQHEVLFAVTFEKKQ